MRNIHQYIVNFLSHEVWINLRRDVDKNVSIKQSIRTWNNLGDIVWVRFNKIPRR